MLSDVGKIRFVTLTVSCVGGDGDLDRQIHYADLCKKVRKFVNRILERLVQMEVKQTTT